MPFSEIISEQDNFNTYPAYLIRAESGATEYLLDRQASSLLVS